MISAAACGAADCAGRIEAAARAAPAAPAVFKKVLRSLFSLLMIEFFMLCLSLGIEFWADNSAVQWLISSVRRALYAPQPAFLETAAADLRPHRRLFLSIRFKITLTGKTCTIPGDSARKGPSGKPLH